MAGRKKYDYIRINIASNTGALIVSYDQYHKCNTDGDFDHCSYRSESRTDAFTVPTTDAEKAAIYDRLIELNTAMI